MGRVHGWAFLGVGYVAVACCVSYLEVSQCGYGGDRKSRFVATIYVGAFC